MPFLFVIGRKPKGGFEEYTIGCKSIESCFEQLAIMVNAGFQVVSARLVVDSDRPIRLPVEAFDGQPMRKSIQALQQQWEEILF